MSILVAGGSGFIGRYLVQRLLENGDEKVVSMDVIPPPVAFMKLIKPHKNRFHFIPGSVANFHEVTNVVKSFSVEKIVNLAFLLPPASEINLPASVSVNIVGHVNVLEAARLLGVSRIICASSVAVYGPQKIYGDRELTEEDAHHPVNIYGFSKDLGEKIAKKYREQYGIQAVFFRPGNAFGHGRENAPTGPSMARLVSLPALGKPVNIEIGGDDKYSLIYVDDIACLVCILLEASSPRYDVYNTGGYTMSLGKLSDVIKEFIPDARITFKDRPRPISVPWSISSARAKEEFNFSIRTVQDAVLAHINFARLEAGLKPI